MYVEQFLEVVRLFDRTSTCCFQVNGEDMYYADLYDRFKRAVIKSIKVYTQINSISKEDILISLEKYNPDTHIDLDILGLHNMFYDIVVFNIII